MKCLVKVKNQVKIVKIYLRQGGFTLIEVLVAVAILALGLLAVIGMQTSVIRGNALSKQMTSALLLAESKMEDLKKNGFGSTSSGAEANTLDETGQAGGIFSRSWVVSPTYQGSANLEQITVTVIWTEHNKTHTISLSTVLSSTLD